MTENLLQLPKSATNRRLPEFLLSHHRSRSGSRSRSVTGNTLRRGRQKRKEKKRKLFVFIFWRQKQKRIFRNRKVFSIHENFCVNAPAQKGNFQKRCKYVSSFLFFFFFLFFLVFRSLYSEKEERSQQHYSRIHQLEGSPGQARCQK